MNRPKFRIVRDRYLEYEVQKKVWWWPFWWEIDRINHGWGTNTFDSLEKARAFIQLHIEKPKERGIVEYYNKEKNNE